MHFRNLYKKTITPTKNMKRSSRRWKKKGQMRWKWQRKKMKKAKRKRKIAK
jgi:large subunit ribosomal protein L41e